MDSSLYSLESIHSTVFHSVLWPLMLFLTQAKVLGSFMGLCLSDRYASQAGETALFESVGAGEDFAFFSGLESFEILGEESDRDYDFSLSLLLLSFVLTSLSFRRFLILLLRFF